MEPNAKIPPPPVKTPRKRAKISPEQRRRYYLHSRVRTFAPVRGKSRQVNVSQELLDSLTAKQQYYLDQLKVQGYNIQYTIL